MDSQSESEPDGRFENLRNWIKEESQEKNLDKKEVKGTKEMEWDYDKSLSFFRG